MTTPTMTWTRLSRRLGSDHNPLRRRADRAEAWLVPAAIAGFLLLSPLVAGAVAQWVSADNAAVLRAQQSWHRAPAVLLHATPGPTMSMDGANSWIARAPARWTENGRPRVGNVPVSSGARADSTVPVWLDRAGNVQVPPLTAGQLGDRVLVAALIALTVLAGLLACLARLGRLVLDRCRLAGWQDEWLAVGPQWSGQR
ncbi:MAG TPA: hypothetical protein VMK13_06300 [Streptosporangiaceae bacterium]|nr:hypothetical protein [Streptosporangiaceae bacterium]